MTARLSSEQKQARRAGLHYVDRTEPGITRRKVGKGFAYYDPAGDRITDQQVIARLKRLGIPPAYRDVWICTDPDGHLQAVGTDARGRLQYRYHPRWRETRDVAKFGRMLVFSEHLPALRAQVAKDLARKKLDRERVLAAIVFIMERTMARIGNDRYARENRSYGLTTLRHRHVDVHGKHVTLDFRAKHGIEQHLDMSDARLARLVSRLEDLPGQRLFQYLDENGERHDVHSQDVNEYLQTITGEDITAKDFRTWAATQLAAVTLCAFSGYDTKAKAKKQVVEAVKSVAARLGNTPAVCRKSYINPCVVDGHLDGTLRTAFQKRAQDVLDMPEHGLSAEEAAVAGFLASRLPHLRSNGTSKP
ncbi:hypothetical protein Gbth_089_010 [Gluconobacter thailandicus F149-1 = NBRC 100600]|uniref:DNA topoisomerase n=1 Tax=Gluconobacter thailandicus NBRC 3257 TaxID=1381097 RepID=A0ABQ0IUL9_GLUTH|nr:DNA topoisomerase IB [Gluconobacter thailandicus]KXV53788.1 DNA topoisomerase I [Gluconobacter thailandicus]GAC86352.1 DNA topoisomerase I [Gluconobacter thailandicus NBRC 3255]GAD25913.1 DNA topoisomerase I [Gluconobacter thailandicus NBRC 3257]GAN94773.1 hypothetical protein Gbth_089_010 [Gluconobacter thailandicus F149-1 = NBRC 100600]GEL87781.1 DNA topoisomerase [Gluconobacter thailandicus F149-1 = NBRC 100600]